MLVFLPRAMTGPSQTNSLRLKLTHRGGGDGEWSPYLGEEAFGAHLSPGPPFPSRWRARKE